MFSGFNNSAEKQGTLSLTISFWSLQCDRKQKKNLTQNLLRISFKVQACQTTNSFNTKILVKTFAQKSREIFWKFISFQHQSHCNNSRLEFIEKYVIQLCVLIFPLLWSIFFYHRKQMCADLTCDKKIDENREWLNNLC